MGLDIYFRKLKNNDKLPKEINSYDDWEKVTDEADNQSRKKFTKAYDFAVKALKKASKENYSEVYGRVIKRICKFSNFPQFHYKELGVDYDYGKNKYIYTPVPVSNFTKNRSAILKGHYAQHIAYFRKVNFVYAYFSPKLIDEVAWVTREDLIDLINRCEKVLKDHFLAETLLPTQSGFFFGSTEYDDWYFYDVEDCKKQMSKLLKGLKDDELIYVAMSW
jgi:hypothetical protein